MDFRLSAEQKAASDLAWQVFSKTLDPDRLASLEASDRRVDDRLWDTLAASGLVSIALPEASGGAGLGMVELGMVLEAAGAHVAKVPLWSAALSAATVARHGSVDQQACVAATVDGTSRLTVALEEFGHHDPEAVTTHAARDGGTWRLTGTKAAVPDLPGAERVVVSAATPRGPALFLVDPDAHGAHLEPVDTTAHVPAANLVLDACVAAAVGDPDHATAFTWLLDRVQVALSWLQVGVASGAVSQAARYLTGREQFGRPLGTFQAVAHRMADCHIRVEAMRVTALNAAWQLDHGEPGTAVLVAAWWASDAGQQVVHDVVHLHGGIGVDLDHPIHRHLLLGREVADTLGGPSQTLARLGAQLDDLPVVPA